MTMTAQEIIQRLTKLKKEMLEDITWHWEQYREPLKMGFLTSPYNSGAKVLGMAAREVLMSMEEEQKVKVMRSNHVTRYLLPWADFEAMSPVDQLKLQDRIDLVLCPKHMRP